MIRRLSGSKPSESSPYSDGSSMRRARSPVAPNIRRVETLSTMAPPRGGPRPHTGGVSHLGPAIRNPVAGDAGRAGDDRARLIRPETVAAAIFGTVRFDD